MGIDCKQLKEIVIVPTLTALGMCSPSAIELLLGTAAQESHMGEYLVQEGIGFQGGIGLYQMQRPSYESVWDNVIAPQVALQAKIRLMLNYNGKPPANRMATDLVLATIMTRLYYWIIKKPLAEAGDIAGHAAFYKKYYNTPAGKATEQEFIDNYKKYVVC